MRRESEIIAKKIRESGFRQRYLAEQIGISEQTLTNIMAGRQNMSVPAMVKLCKVMHTDPNTMLDFKRAE